jgi:hypothetical protein
MKQMKLWVPVLILFGLFAMAYAADSASDVEKQRVRHVVCFKFKDDADPAGIQKVEEAFVALKDKIPAIADIEWGTNMSPEKLDQGFTHCFLLTFNSVKDRDAYLPHPDHKAFGKVLGPVLDKVFVIDYIAKK